MEILYILIPLSIILIGIAIRVFIWAVKNDQFEDLDGPAHRILYDDDDDMIPPEARRPGTRDTDGDDPNSERDR